MRAGNLKNKITIQTPTESQDTKGEVTFTWTTYAVRWAQITTETGTEFNESQKVQGRAVTLFKVRYDSKTKAITPKMRIQFDGRTFDIQPVSNFRQMNREIHIPAFELV